MDMNNTESREVDYGLVALGSFSQEFLVEYTRLWDGERFPDGRPKVPHATIERIAAVIGSGVGCTGIGRLSESVRGQVDLHPPRSDAVRQSRNDDLHSASSGGKSGGGGRLKGADERRAPSLYLVAAKLCR